MCEILHIKPGVKVHQERLYNAAANNWHSWGLLAKNPEKKEFSIVRQVPLGADISNLTDPKIGGTYNDLDVIQKFLDVDHLNEERFLHFRHATRGDITLENTHPFLVYKDKRREVYMMHNGTINNHGSVTGTWAGGRMVESDGDSDTKDFVEKRLIPSLKWVRGNYLDPEYQELMWKPLYDKFGSNSRFLFVANDLEPFRVGSWTPFINPDSKEELYFASEARYLEKVERGPVFIEIKKEEERRRKEEEEKNPKEEKVTQTFGRGTTVSITTYDRNTFLPDPKIFEGISWIFKNFGEGITRNELSDLYYLSVPELTSCLEALLTEDDGVNTIAGFIDFVLREHYDVAEQLEKAEKAKVKGEGRIVEQKVEINRLEDVNKRHQTTIAELLGKNSNLAQQIVKLGGKNSTLEEEIARNVAA